MGEWVLGRKNTALWEKVGGNLENFYTTILPYPIEVPNSSHEEKNFLRLPLNISPGGRTSLDPMPRSPISD